MYVADTGNDRVVKWAHGATQGGYLGGWGRARAYHPDASGFHHPHSVQVGAYYEGNDPARRRSVVYVADTYNWRALACPLDDPAATSCWVVAGGHGRPLKMAGSGYLNSDLRYLAKPVAVKVQSFEDRPCKYEKTGAHPGYLHCVYVVDAMQHRVTLWLPGRAAPILVAGSRRYPDALHATLNGTPADGGAQLNQLAHPHDLVLDETSFRRRKIGQI